MRLASGDRILAALLLPLFAHPAFANTEATASVPEVPSTRPELPVRPAYGAGQAPAPTIVIGRAVDLVGVPLRIAQPRMLSGADKTPATRGAGPIGPFAMPDQIQFSPGLPKTRSGKIMRRILRKIAEDDFSNLGDTSTLAEPAVVEDLIANRQNRKSAGAS